MLDRFFIKEIPESTGKMAQLLRVLAEQSGGSGSISQHLHMELYYL